ncbi:MAG TPA: FeoC-like transcriptional regulator [Anaerolineaceae bacterium]|nr:FeoC-like transcriptional regulator [Anaerolineaceae bacterium]HPN53661.1 FeoC-like transcriptional regulator [Anaerolineaceae bacterium]
MLNRLLQILSSQQPQNKTALASALGTSLPLLDEMIIRLVQMGYLEEMNSCAASCGHCAAADGCLFHMQGQALVLTEKGRRAASTGHHAVAA